MNSLAFPIMARLSARSNALSLAFSRSIAQKMRARVLMLPPEGTIRRSRSRRLPAPECEPQSELCDEPDTSAAAAGQGYRDRWHELAQAQRPRQVHLECPRLIIGEEPPMKSMTPLALATC